jgi:hypothetical protein
MSFQNTVLSDGSINITVVPTFGRIVNANEADKQRLVRFYHYLSYLKCKDGKQSTDH